MVSVDYGQEWILRGSMRGMHSPTSLFQKCFYKFSVISNLFVINLSPWVRIIENVRTKCIIFGEALKIRVKKVKQYLRENYSKNTKIAATACKFSKISRVTCPWSLDLPRAFLVSQSASNLFCPKKKKKRLKQM